MSDDEQRVQEAAAEFMRTVPVQDVIVSMVQTVFDVGYHRTGLIEGGDQRDLAQTALAIETVRALLPVLERVLGPAYPDTLAARHELARWTGEAGDPAAARDQFAALLPVRERVSGPEHPDTLAARHELAGWTGQAGNPAAARDLFAGLLPVLERVLGPVHPHSLIARHQLASWTESADSGPNAGVK